jgi:hypothetical protein
MRKRSEEKTELRFSFTQPTDDERLKPEAGVQTHRDQKSASKRGQSDRPLLSSFSDLSFEGSKTGAVQKSKAKTTEQPIIGGIPNRELPRKSREGYGFSFSDSLFCDTFEGSKKGAVPKSQAKTNEQPIIGGIPNRELPKKRREGYGFSFSDSLFRDTEGYADNEYDWGSETEKAPTPPPEQVSFLGSVGPANIALNSSFDDFVVVRDVGSFHLAKPQRRLTCTHATQEDTIRIKHAAKALLKYDESSNIHAGILSRLERMVHRSVQKSASGHTQAASALQCALKLQDFLIRTKGGRVDTGEVVRVVEHEIEWATWLVEASRTGVMHIKGQGCKCRPEWEEE